MTKVDEVKVNGRWLRKGMEISVNRAPGRRGGRYRFDFAEVDGDKVLLGVYGPLPPSRSIAHYRTFSTDAVKTVHQAGE